MELPYDPAIALPGIYPKNTRTLIQRDTCTPMFMATLFTVTEIQKQPKCQSIKEEVACAHAQWNITQPQKKNKSLQFVTTWTKLEYNAK